MSGDVHVQFCERPGVRFPRATHLVILIDGYRRWRWLETTVYKRLLEETGHTRRGLNRDKTRRVDLAKGESFTFLGFSIRRAWDAAGQVGGCLCAEDSGTHQTPATAQGGDATTLLATG